MNFIKMDEIILKFKNGIKSKKLYSLVDEIWEFVILKDININKLMNS